MLEARHQACLGRIEYARSQARTGATSKQALDESIRSFETSIALDGACETYVGLGLALAAKAGSFAAPTRRALRGRAETCCRLAHDGTQNGSTCCDLAPLRAAIATASAADRAE